MLRKARRQDQGNWWEQFDWCGPYISDGKFQSSTPGFTTARSAQEQRCKEHDIAYSQCKSQKCFEEADRRFSGDSWGTSVLGSAQSILVHYGGKYFHGDYSEDKKRKAEETPGQASKRVRGQPNLTGNKRSSDSSAGPSQSKARRRIDFNPEEHPPPPPGQVEVEAKMSGAAGGNGTQGEIGLKPFGRVANSQPDYFTSKFTWIFEDKIDTSDGSLAKKEFRINSPYDPSINITAAGDTQRNSAVNGWAMYSERYKYYRLVSCKAHISVIFPIGGYNHGGVGTDTAYLGNQKKAELRTVYPKAVGVNINPGRIFPYDAVAVSSWRQMANCKYSKFKILNGEYTRADFTIDYTPEMWDTPVQEQQREQFWTNVATNPLLQDTYTVWYQTLERNGSMSSDNVFPYLQGHLVITHEMTVQFREWSQSILERSLLPDMHASVDTALPIRAFTTASETVDETD